MTNERHASASIAELAERLLQYGLAADPISFMKALSLNYDNIS